MPSGDGAEEFHVVYILSDNQRIHGKKDTAVDDRELSVSIRRIVTVQPAPFVKPHFVLIAAVAVVLLIDGRSAHLTASRRILMRA